MIFPVADFIDGTRVQNIILVALKSETIPGPNDTDPELDSFLQHLWKTPIDMDKPILTDDFAPVDYYINKTI